MPEIRIKPHIDPDLKINFDGIEVRDGEIRIKGGDGCDFNIWDSRQSWGDFTADGARSRMDGFDPKKSGISEDATPREQAVSIIVKSRSVDGAASKAPKPSEIEGGVEKRNTEEVPVKDGIIDTSAVQSKFSGILSKVFGAAFTTAGLCGITLGIMAAVAASRAYDICDIKVKSFKKTNKKDIYAVEIDIDSISNDTQYIAGAFVILRESFRPCKRDEIGFVIPSPPSVLLNGLMDIGGRARFLNCPGETNTKFEIKGRAHDLNTFYVEIPSIDELKDYVGCEGCTNLKIGYHTSIEAQLYGILLDVLGLAIDALSDFDDLACESGFSFACLLKNKWFIPVIIGVVVLVLLIFLLK